MEFKVNNNREQEIMLLYATVDKFRGMHNYLIMDAPQSQVVFKTEPAKEIYYILLTDFLSLIPEPFLLEKKKISTLQALIQLSDNPILNSSYDTKDLNIALQTFKDWLLAEALIEKMWLANIEKEIDFKITRSDMIRIAGNLMKHDVLRLQAVIKIIKQTFAKNEIDPSDNNVMLCLEHFDEWFNENVLLCHATIISQMMIDIQWCVWEYLKSIYDVCLKTYYDKKFQRWMYRYDVPNSWEIPKESIQYYAFWELMNSVRAKPIFEKFKCDKYLQGRY